ncbi:hypothetical protein AMTR_s00048p00203160 [Amborella trichopoda]|uniref:Uncharacterized protein n=1 Tax=Amborella trichopoda TaxID=13333 RepID=U5CR29_AMBTC|nr:hypothetical protein AMTR_s00048p00203160 [Amborella trichopoda]
MSSVYEVGIDGCNYGAKVVGGDELEHAIPRECEAGFHGALPFLWKFSPDCKVDGEVVDGDERPFCLQ